MKYPTISFGDAAEYVHSRQEGKNILSVPEPRLKGEGRNISLDIHKSISNAFEGWREKAANASNQQKKDAIEGEYAIKLFESFDFLMQAPEVLTDRDFWRYLAINHMYDFCEWRETRVGNKCSPAAWGADSRSIDRDCVPYRMFNRALVARGIDLQFNSKGMKYARIASGDMWKSHVLRYDISYSPSMVKVLLDKFDSKDINTQTVRPAIKGIGRVHANVMYEVFADEDAKSIWNSEISQSLD